MRKANGQSRSPAPNGIHLVASDPGADGRVANAPSRRWPNVASIVAGAWLVASAFTLLHSAPSRTNTWFVGLLIIAGGVWGLREPVGRLLNALLGAWLVMSTLAISSRLELTFWHNVGIGVIVLVLSLLPNRAPGARRH
jgi:hypothetical protein